MPQGPGPLRQILMPPPNDGPRMPLDPTPLAQTNPGLARLVDFFGGLTGLKDALDPQSSNSTMLGAGLSAALPLMGAIGGLRKVAAKYPLAKNWYSHQNYAEAGGRMVEMSPDDFLRQVRPLEIDEVSRENIDLLKKHIVEKGELDPLALYADGKEDGRHRAIAAKELGITKVPVLTWKPDQSGDDIIEIKKKLALLLAAGAGTAAASQKDKANGGR